MMPKIKDGDIVFVRSQNVVDDGDIGIFVIDDDGFCKQLKLDHEHGKAYLMSLNPQYDPIEITKDMVVRAVGRVLL